MKITLAVIFFLCCLSLSEAHAVKNHNRKKMKTVKEDLDGLDVKIAKLVEDTNRILECLNTSRSDPNYHNVCVEPEEEEGSGRSLDRTDVTLQAGESSSPEWSTLIGQDTVLLLV